MPGLLKIFKKGGQQKSIQTTSKKKAGSLSLLSLTSIFFMSVFLFNKKTNQTKPTSNFNSCSYPGLPYPRLTWRPNQVDLIALAFDKCKATLPQTSARGGNDRLDSSGWIFGDKITKRHFGTNCDKFLWHTFLMCLSCDRKHNIIYLFVDADFFVVLKFGKFPKPFCLSFFQNVSLSAVFPAFNTMILSIDLSTRWLTLNSTLGWHEPWNPDEFSFREPYFRGLWNNPEI